VADLTAKTAIITGASRGFGRAMALRFAQEGADVVVGYRSARAEAEAVAAEIRALGRRAVMLQVDVAQEASVTAFAEAVLDSFGRVDVLVNNAGIMDVHPFLEQPLETYRATVEVNVMGMLLVTRALLPSMIARGQGSVINLASQLGHIGGENFAVYAGTKGFVLAYTKSLAREVGPRGVRVNAICPGSIVTDMNRSIYPPQRAAQKAAELPLRRMGDPDDVAQVALFLASEASNFITGQCIDVNGGATMV
jgi:3-oxoacyl-[acyl-carrier protein] reductase